jgi:hypothetical protein
MVHPFVHSHQQTATISGALVSKSQLPVASENERYPNMSNDTSFEVELHMLQPCFLLH